MVTGDHPNAPERRITPIERTMTEEELPFHLGPLAVHEARRLSPEQKKERTIHLRRGYARKKNAKRADTDETVGADRLVSFLLSYEGGPIRAGELCISPALIGRKESLRPTPSH